MKKITQRDLILEFFKQHPNKDISHPEAVDWLTNEWSKRTQGQVFRDPDRGIRKLSQEGYLIKVSKGVYRYDPEYIINDTLEDFTEKQKQVILKRDDYKCVICGKGKKDGEEIHVDHIKPKDKGGKATIENGQTLCSTHNFRKKNYSQTETGKKMFLRLQELAEKNNDMTLLEFCNDILETFDKHDINGHIEWKKSNGKTKKIHERGEIL